VKFKVVVDFIELNIIELNVSDAESAAQSVLKLFNEGRLKTKINEIAVFDIEDEFGFEPPIFTLKPE
jgi:hypothetical protein